MSAFRKGDLVKIKATNKEAIINTIEIKQGDFNRVAHKHIHTDQHITDMDEESVNTYICFIENENGIPEKNEFKYEDLTLVRRG